MATTRIVAGALAAALTLCLAPAAAQTPRRVPAAHTVVEFLVDREPEATTREVWAGLRFELEQGWHVYWQNPGDSGGPPTILWQPAGGLVPGEFQWPVPERLPLGPLVNYGYTNEVVLPFPVKVTRLPGAGAPLEGQVKWLICKDVCIPGQTRLAMPLPIGDGNRGRVATWRRQIQEARARVPAPAPPAWRATATASDTEFVLTVHMDTPATGGSFFPLETSQIDDAAAQPATAAGNALVLRLRKSDNLTSDPHELRGVLALASGRAFVVRARVTAAASGAVR